MDRQVIRSRIKQAVDNGYATHRVAQRILIESLEALADALCDELEKDKKPLKKEKAA